MLKLFISQPMKGKTNGEIQKEREYLISMAKELYGDDIEVLDSFFEGFETSNWNSLRFLAESIKLLSEADIAIFSKDWESARGCRIEHECAIQYGMETVESYSY